MRFVLSFCLLISLSVSLSAQETEKVRITDYEPLLQAQFTSLSIGDPKDTVLTKMGGVRVVKVRGLGLRDDFACPYRSEQLSLNDSTTAEFLWYKVWEKEKTATYVYSYEPVVLKNGHMVGQGRSFAKTFAAENGIRLTIP